MGGCLVTRESERTERKSIVVKFTLKKYKEYVSHLYIYDVTTTDWHSLRDLPQTKRTHAEQLAPNHRVSQPVLSIINLHQCTEKDFNFFPNMKTHKILISKNPIMNSIANRSLVTSRTPTLIQVQVDLEQALHKVCARTHARTQTSCFNLVHVRERTVSGFKM